MTNVPQLKPKVLAKTSARRMILEEYFRDTKSKCHEFTAIVPNGMKIGNKSLRGKGLAKRPPVSCPAHPVQLTDCLSAEDGGGFASRHGDGT
jgi:hypothetical protein